MTDAPRAGVPERRAVQTAISDQMVRIYEAQFGRGPTKARSDFAGPDVLVCSLQDTSASVSQLRLFFQRAAATEFREAVERITGRTVLAFVSGTDTERDLSAEVFYLERQETGPSIRLRGTVLDPPARSLAS
jgi:uncharacterized protein YbcI